MNHDHSDAVLSYANAFTGFKELRRASLTHIDAQGIDLSCEAADSTQAARIAFPSPLDNADQVRSALIKLVKLSRTIEKYNQVPAEQFQPIACGHHDHLELAATFNYTLDIQLRDGETITAKAIDTKSSKERGEFLVVALCGKEIELRTDLIKSITALDSNAQFSTIDLAINV